MLKFYIIYISFFPNFAVHWNQLESLKMHLPQRHSDLIVMICNLSINIFKISQVIFLRGGNIALLSTFGKWNLEISENNISLTLFDFKNNWLVYGNFYWFFLWFQMIIYSLKIKCHTQATVHYYTLVYTLLWMWLYYFFISCYMQKSNNDEIWGLYFILADLMNHLEKN